MSVLASLFFMLSSGNLPQEESWYNEKNQFLILFTVGPVPQLVFNYFLEEKTSITYKGTKPCPKFPVNDEDFYLIGVYFSI